MKFETTQNAFRALKIIALTVVLQLFMLLANKAFNQTDAVFPNTILYKIGDHPSWANKQLNDQDWSANKSKSKGIYWLRAEFDLNNHIYPSRKKEMFISILGSYEAYFDGVLIGENGKVGENSSQEIPGYLDQKFMLPDTLTQHGRRVLALRISNNLGNGNFNNVSVYLDSYNEFYKYRMVLSLLLYTLAGIFLTVAIYYFFLFFISHRRIGYLEFGIFCFILFVLIFQTYSRHYWPYLYTQYTSWLYISSILSLCAAIMLPIFLINNFNYPKKKRAIGISILLVVTAFIVFSTDEMAPLFFSVIISTVITIWAIFKKRVGSWEALTGLLIFLTGIMYFDLTIFVGFAVLVIANLFSFSVIQREEKRVYEESLLRSSRLKLELLKKNLTPHFLINTLTNIISLIENEPKTSVRLIEALSEEFYSLNEMTNEKLISLEKELTLCKSHLEVMGIRNDTVYKLDTEINSSGIRVPPAIIHTLLENGITHCEPIDGQIRFDLVVKETNSKTTVQFKVLGKFERKSKKKEGTGIEYVRSRLEESFPGKWNLSYGEWDNHTWYTNIDFSR